jgi:hypothetical protein
MGSWCAHARRHRLGRMNRAGRGDDDVARLAFGSGGDENEVVGTRARRSARRPQRHRRRFGGCASRAPCPAHGVDDEACGNLMKALDDLRRRPTADRGKKSGGVSSIVSVPLNA